MDSALDPDTARGLPIAATPLVGREQETAEVIALIWGDAHRDRVRLLTLTGPGGVGKTRLALHVANVTAPGFAAGVCFVPLAPVRDPALVVPTIAQALDIRDADGVPLADRLISVLRPKAMLLILDNVEQVVEAAPDVAALLATCPRLQVLVTSRSTLRISGEHVYTVQPLAVPEPDAPAVSEGRATDAVRLFVDRATAADHRFVLTDANASTVAAICRRLDGLPLAIELAAARASALPPAALLLRLEKRLPLLTGGPRDAPHRLRTMRDAIAWSHDLLGTAEQGLFQRLAVFVDGFTLEAADAVAGGGTDWDLDIIDGVASLVSKSLVHRIDQESGEPRFSMLETIREYGLEQLDARGEVEATRRRMAAWLVHLTERAFPELFGPQQRRWQDWFQAEHDNLRAALSWAVDRGEAETAQRLSFAATRYWYTRGHFTEGRRWADQALASGSTSDAVRAKAMAAAGWLASEQGDHRRAIELQEAGLALARKAGDMPWIAQASTALGLALEDEGRFGEAKALHEAALRDHRALGDTVWPPFALNALGLVAYEQGETDNAADYFEEALAEFRACDNSYGAGFALTNLAKVARSRGDYVRANRLFAESLGLRWDDRDKRGIVGCLRGLASVAALTDRFERAARLFGAAEGLREVVGASVPRHQTRFPDTVAQARNGLGETSFEASWLEGRSLPLSAVVAEAMELLPVAATTATSRGRAVPAERGGLSPRELEVLRLIAAGSRDQEIADTLFISRRTVQAHVSHLFRKLGVDTRAEATATAMRRGLV